MANYLVMNMPGIVSHNSLSRPTLPILALLVTSLNSAAASGADIKYHTVSGRNVITITGDIESGDDLRFKELAHRHVRAVVVLRSAGGSLLPALKVGETLRARKYQTVVQTGSTCTSACALIWLAGSPRFIYEGARVGFHASYVGVGGLQLESGIGNALVGRYLTQLGLPERAVVFATTASPYSILWLTPKKMAEAGIQFQVVRSPGSPTRPVGTQLGGQVYDRVVGPWKIWRRSEACWMTRKWRDGSDLNFSVKEGEPRVYLLLLNYGWASVQQGRSYRINVGFGGQATALAATGISNTKLGKGISLFLPSSAWLSERLAHADTISFSRNGKLLGAYPLTQGEDAYRALHDCLVTKKGR